MGPLYILLCHLLATVQKFEQHHALWPMKIPVLADGPSRVCVVTSYSPTLLFVQWSKRKLFGAAGGSENWFCGCLSLLHEFVCSYWSNVTLFRPVHLLNTQIHTCMDNCIELVLLVMCTKHIDKHNKSLTDVALPSWHEIFFSH